MKRISILLMAFTMTFGMAMAQSPGKGGQRNMDQKSRAERMTERMVKEFSLNDTQKQKLLVLNMSMTEQMSKDKPQRVKATKMTKAQKADKKCDCKCDCKKDSKKAEKLTRADRTKHHEAMKASREAYNSKVKEIMTQEQYDAFTKKQSERAAKFKDGHRSSANRRV